MKSQNLHSVKSQSTAEPWSGHMVTPPRTPVTPIAASYSDGHYDEAQWYLGEALVYHQLERGGAGKSVPRLKHLIISNHPIQASYRTMSSQVMPFKKEYD
jgi:hypothetical protein